MKPRRNKKGWISINQILPDPEERYKLFTELISDMVYSMKVNEDNSVEGEWASDSFAKVMGYSLEELDYSKGIDLIVHPEDRDAFWKHIGKILSGRESFIETRIVAKNGNVKWLQDSAMPLLDKGGKRVVRIVGAVKDITKRKEAEFELAKTNRKLSSLNEVFKITTSSTGKDELLAGVIEPIARFAGSDFAFIFAVDEGEAVLTASSQEAPDLLPRFSSLSLSEAEEGVILEIRRKTPRKKRALRTLNEMREELGVELLAALPLVYEDKTYAIVVAAYRDDRETLDWLKGYIIIAGNHIGLACERMKLLSLKAARENELRKLADNLVEGIESERRNLAIKLHDELGQILVGLSMEFDILERSIPKVSAESSKIVKDIKGQLQKIVESTREISYSLHPAMLKDLGLISTLQWYVKRFVENAGIEVQIEAVGFNGALPYKVALALYRIAQEALANARKHSRADRVKLRLTRGVPSVIMIIEDNGAGFKSEKNAVTSKGLGIIGMRERVEGLNGTLNISTSPGKGTKIRVSIPVEV